jgi:DNA-binding LacI/PurR family transcriptional regulator
MEVDGLAPLARRLEQDMRSRGLRAGDRYRTAAEAAVLLGVSTATAHRAMQLLVKNRMLVRQHGRGTFVGSAISEEATSIRVQTVFVFIPEGHKEVASTPFEALLDAIRQRQPDVGVQFSFVPRATGDVEYVREVVRLAQAGGQYAGAVPCACSREVYRCLSEVGGPLVVLGSLFSDQQHIPSLDFDYRQSGFLLAHHLCQRGNKRLALITTGSGRPGDGAFLDGVTDGVTEAGLPPNALIMRSFPQDVDTFRAMVHEMLASPKRPTGIICGSERLLNLVASVVSDMGLADEVELVFQGQAGAPSVEHSPYVHVQPTQPFAEIASMVADMFASLATGKQLRQHRVVVPVELRKPG